ncbi:glycosyltransferase family 4 protein [Chloroflexota bacterium]
MKILYVQDTDWIRRNPIQHTHLAERLVKRGHEIRAIDYEILWRHEGKKELFSKRQVFHIFRLLENADVTVIRPAILKIPVMDYASMLLTYTREIKRQIREFQPDIIIGDCILTSYLGYREARKHGIPTVYYALDTNHKLIPFRFLHAVGKLIESNNIKKANIVLAINQGLREYTIRMGADPSRTKVITAGTDSGRFDATTNGGKTRWEIREKYGIRPEDLLLFFVGWIHDFNGIAEVALEMARTGAPDIKFLVIGDGDGYPNLVKIRDKYNLHEKFILTGHKPYDEIPAYLCAADICVFPAYSNEPIVQNIVPIKMYDYLTAGKPIISTRLDGIYKEFGDDSGIVYVKTPEETLHKALQLSREKQLDKFGADARHFAVANAWEKKTDDFEKVLDTLVKDRLGT